jgi:tRNA A-37 threonylcarbamoyl transferase component Bud32
VSLEIARASRAAEPRHGVLPTHSTVATVSSDVAPDALMRSRLLVYAGVTGGVSLVGIIAIVIGELLYRMPYPWLTRPAGLTHLVTTLALGLITALLARSRGLSRRSLRWLDVAITLLLALQSAAITLFEVPRAAQVWRYAFWTPNQAQELKGLLMVAHVLLLRAAVVPSRASRTAWLGLAAGAMGCTATGIAYALTPMPAQYASVPLVNALLWSAFSIAVSTAASNVIYGLRRQVHDATQLGQYTLEHKLGQGGMGVVYRARHALLRRPTAIKVLLASKVGRATIERFEREVQLTAKLSHPNIVSVYDFGRTHDGTFYYAMELIDGIDLQLLVEESGPQCAGRVLAILKQAARALAEAHAVQLIHRDIKPANMVLTRRAAEADVVKLVDFGLVKEVDGASTQHSHAHEMRGTPLYMSPEAVLTPERVGPASDLYALGAVGYFLLVGQTVFEGKNTFTVLGMHAHVPPRPPSERVDGVPAKLERVILRCLEKDPARRYADARELCLALEACDDVPSWSDDDALAWWRSRAVAVASGRVAPSSSLPGAVLTVDLHSRAAAK